MAWDKSVSFTATQNLPFVPSKSFLVFFIAEMSKTNYVVTAIFNYLAGIKYQSRLVRLFYEGVSFKIKKIIKEYCNFKANVPDIRLAITKVILEQIVWALPLIVLIPYQQTLIKAIYYLTFYAFCQFSNSILSKLVYHAMPYLWMGLYLNVLLPNKSCHVEITKF